MAGALYLFGLTAVVTVATCGVCPTIVRTLVKHGAEVLAVDIAKVVLLLATDDSVFVSGSRIIDDGCKSPAEQ
ncbi:MAG: hypothetical protein VYC03_09275 [Pseudomonadota bacterium]|nr:hypothetical protein [Pseudomonadota bacterium]